MHGSFLARVTSALGILLLVALVTRVVWELLQPVIPGLIVLALLGAIATFAVGRKHRW